MSMVFCALLLPTILGFFIIALLLGNEHDTGILERLCLSYPLGMGLLTTQMFFLGLLRVPLTLGYTSLPIIVEIVALFLWIRSKNIAVIPRPDFGLLKEMLSPRSSRIKKTALFILSLWVGVKLLSVFFETGLRPIFAWDSWANWSATAKAFYYQKSLLLQEPSEYFFGRGTVSRITAYPLNNPLMQMWLGQWAGAFDEVLVKFWTPAYLLSAAGLMYSMASRELGRLIGAAMLVIFLSSPLMSYHGTEVYSDLPLGVYLFLATASFFYVIRGKEAYVSLAGLFSAEALLTKDEALFFVLPLLLSLCFYLWSGRQQGQPRLRLLALLAPLAAAVPWYVFKWYHHLGMGGVALEFAFHPEVIVSVAQNIMRLENFNIVLLFFPLLLLLNGKPEKEFTHLLLPLACYALFFFSLYAFTRANHLFFTQGTIFYRNLLTGYPTLCFLTALLIKKQLLLFAQFPVRRAAR